MGVKCGSIYYLTSTKLPKTQKQKKNKKLR
jgi:hypothetical protein